MPATGNEPWGRKAKAYIKRQNADVIARRLAPGVMVRISRHFSDNEGGVLCYGTLWNEEKHNMVGKVYPIHAIGSYIHINGYGFPYFVLEVVDGAS